MADEEAKAKEIFNNEYLKYFSAFFDVSKLEKRIINYKYLVEELKRLDTACPEKTFQHVYSKKNTLISKNAKKMCRDGVALKYIKPIVLKMFKIDYSNDDYRLKSKSVFKGRALADVGDYVPLFTNKSFVDSLPCHFLNDSGIEALKEILWMINSVTPAIEYCPLIIKITAFLLILFSKEETYEIMRNLLEMNLCPAEINNLRWHFRFGYKDNMKIGHSITEAILNLADEQTKTRFKNLDEVGCPKNNLIQDMAESFFLDYLNFIGVLRFLPFFLYEGTKSIYRLSYAIIKETPFHIVNKIKESEVLLHFKTESGSLTNMANLFEVSYKLALNRNNNKYISQEVVDIKEIRPSYYYLPLFTPNSKILTDKEIILIWSVLPLQIKTVDAKLMYSTSTSPEANLETLYEICEKNEKNSTIFFMIETDKDEVFGGIMTHNIQLTESGKYERPLMAYLISVRPEITLYGPQKGKKQGVVLFEPGAMRFGYGENGPAISIDHDLKIGITEKETVYGNVSLLKDYSNGGEFNIKNMEVYLMI